MTWYVCEDCGNVPLTNSRDLRLHTALDHNVTKRD